MTDYRVHVVHREEVKVVGLKVRTNMAKAAEDAPRLWEHEFGPRMPEVATFPNYSYGVSVMVDKENFDYWAALPLRPGDPIPSGMGTIDLPAGQYAEIRMDSLAELAGAYMHIFQNWLPNSNFELVNAPCYELYPANYPETGSLALYMPVTVKSA